MATDGDKHPFETAFYELLELFRGHFTDDSSTTTSLQVKNILAAYCKALDEVSIMLVIPGNVTSDVNVATLGNDLLTFTKEFLSSPFISGLVSASEPFSIELVKVFQTTLEFYRKVFDFNQGRIAWIKTIISVLTSLYGTMMKVISRHVITVSEKEAIHQLEIFLLVKALTLRLS